MLSVPLMLVVLFLLQAATLCLSAEGLYSGAVPGAHLVHPRKVSGDSGLGQDDLEHHHDTFGASSRARKRVRRLAVEQAAHWVPDAGGYDAPAVEYELSLDGSSAPNRLMLWPSTSFMAPALRVDRLASGSSGSSGERARAPRGRRGLRSSTSCHFRGYVRGDPQSTVALSACGRGLVGFVKTQKADYWLEPTAEGVNGSSAHLIFQKRRNKGARRKGEWRRRKRRRRRRRHDKDCGTRDPHRPHRPHRGNETAVAWGRGRGSSSSRSSRSSGGGLWLSMKERRGRRGHHGNGSGGGRSESRSGARGRGRRSRKTRSVSREKHVEVLVVADDSMTAFHQDEDLETYLLTIMNMVSALYHDPSIGNLINLVVVRIITVDEWASEDSFNVSVNADRTLTSFCRWATEINPAEETDPLHHDVAVLITRVDLCARRDSPCNTLGVAHVGGMCTSDRACSVNQDNGIVLAHTIAHEMGHNFGMTHDTESSGCPRKVDSVLHVMTPTFEADNHRMAWSPCSRRTITAFLDEGKGACLDDPPTLRGYQYPDLPAGSMYDAEHQCRLQFGSEEASVCSDMEEVCTRLWCDVDGECTTLLQPAAFGTVCGKHKWCQEQQCVEIGDLPEPVPGGWSSWGEWGPCSRSCGAGVSVMERLCDHPAPRHGGAYCLGERRRYRVCNTQPCPQGEPSFRAVQCAAYNNRTYHGANYTWLPYFDSAEPCELYCSDSEDTVIVPWGGAVADGTPCNVGRRDMCIGHVCRKVGCDWTVDSDAVEDRCGVCRGDGSQCDTVTGMYNRPAGFGYTEAVVIPSGARNVLIQEVEPSKNFIGIGSTTKSVFYLNGRRKITLPGEYEVAGTVALYERLGDLETVRIPGPIRDDILIFVIFRGRIRNPGLRYEYTVRRPGVPAPSLSWQWADWSPCSATCGGGRQELRAACSSHSGTLPDEECELTVGPRPPDRNRTCATHACPATWWSGPWQLCSATCGEGEGEGEGVRRRSVLCVLRARQDMALPDAECDQSSRPAEQEWCQDLPPCPAPAPTQDMFPVTLSRPSAASRPHQDVLELDGLDLDNLDQDERDFLNSNYTTFFQDTPQVLAAPASGNGNSGVWEDDMDLPERPARPRPLPAPARARPRKRRPANPGPGPGRRADRGKALGRRRNKNGKLKQGHSKDTFFLTIE